MSQIIYNVRMYSKILDYRTIIGTLILLVLGVAIFLFLRGDTPILPDRLLGQVSSFVSNQESTNKRSADVRINSTDSKGRYQSQAVISLTSQQEPSINVAYYKNYKDQIVDNLKVDVYQIAKNDLLNFLTYTKESDKKYVSRTVDVGAFKKISSLNFDRYPFDKNILLPLSGSGLWLVRATANNNEFNDAVIIRSDTGVVSKEENNQYLFWAQNITSGKHLLTGFIEVYNLEDEAKQLSSKVINGVGIATALIKEEADIALFSNSVTGETALVPLNIPQSWYYRYNRFSNKDVKSKYYLFTDRPLYKPGDTLYFKSIIREDDDAVYSIPSGTARVRIFYGYEQEDPLFEKTYPISFEGTVSGEYTLPNTARTGVYQMEISTSTTEGDEDDREYWLRTVASFNVENFRKPEYTLDSHAKNLEIIRGDKAEFRIDGAYLFGQPLAGQVIDVRLRTDNFYDYDYGYEIDEDSLKDRFTYGYWYGSEIASAELTLNSNGQAVYLHDTSNLQKPRSYGYSDSRSQVLTLEASFNDESGNQVITTANILVRNGEYSIFRKDRLYSIPMGRSQEIPIIIKPHTDAPVSNIELSGSVKLTYWENPASGRGYTKFENNVKTLTLRTDKNGEAVIPFVPERSGSYEFLLEGKDRRGNVIQRKFSVWVYDRGGYTYFGEPGVGAYNLDIKTDKEAYLLNETAKLTITSDVADRDVLLTIERDRVRRYFVIPLIGFSAEFPLIFTSTDLPNVFAAVSGFAPTGFANSSEKLTLIVDSKKINIDLSYDKEKYAPGETVRLTVKTTDHDDRPLSADVAVWTVDKAIYAVMSDIREPIFDFFWQERVNGTTLAHSLEGIRSLPVAERGGCFVKGTPVLVPGGTKSIEDIKIGDIILTRKSLNSDELVKATVTQTFSHLVDGYLVINGYLKVTPEHRLWVNGAWRNAGDIQVGDTLLDSFSKTVIVSSIEWQGGQFEVYNFSVKDYHTYFAGGVWVHNDKGDADARTVFKDVVYWNPHVRTNAQGIATVSFVLPDNLTTWVVNAVSATRDTKIGENLEEFIVTKPVIARPILPNYVRTGDSIEFSSLIYNYTPATSDFAAMCSLSDKSAEKNLTIASNNFTQFTLPSFTFDAADEKAMFRCKAQSLSVNESDEVKIPFPIRKFGFLEPRTMVGQGNKEYTLALNPDSDFTLSNVIVSLTPSIFGTLPNAMKYLIQYPYGCVEQTTSRFVPAVIAKENQKLFAEFLKDKELDAMIDKGIERLVDLKGSKGGWGWWHGNDINPFITVYATEYLLRAKKLGHDVPKSVFDEVQTWAERRMGEQNLVKEERVAIIYILTLFSSEKGRTQITDFEGLTPDVHALAIIANIANGNFNKRTNGVEALLAKGEAQGDTIRWGTGRGDFFGSQDASTAIALRALVAARELQAAERVAQYFSQNRNERYWSNTFATAQVLEALTSLAKAISLDTKAVSYRVLLDGSEISKGTMTDPLAVVDIKLDPKEFSTESAISINIDGEGPLYSTILVDEYRTDRNLKATNNGLEVFREYRGDFIPGGTVEVFITVSGPTEDNAHLVIEDYLPAGLIPINTRLESERASGERYGYGDYYQSGLDFKDDGAIFGYEWWHGGTIIASYKARVVSRGEFTAPPAVASLMYSPQVSGRSAIHTIRVSDKDAGVVKVSDQEQKKPAGAEIPSKDKKMYLWILVGIAVLAASFVLYEKFKKKVNGKGEQ